MIATGSNRLAVPGATLFYRARGAGPVLLILPGGHGDADTTDALCDRLFGRYTVVTYDRRGLARSPIDASAAAPTLATHGDDAHRLLAALGAGPALVFGSSIGALIGLDLVAKHPQHVRAVVAHEPPAWELLPDAERDDATQRVEDIVTTFKRNGANAAFRKFTSLVVVDPADREPEVALLPTTPQSVVNINFFFANDAACVNGYRLDLPALTAAAAGIVAAGGVSSRHSPSYRCAVALSKKLTTAFVEFPGGHTGWLLRPNGFAAKLLELLDARCAASPAGP
jgi:pimeloyl-ACP methyl ester carboxylesterase